MTSQPLPEKPEMVDLAVDGQGKIYWNDLELVSGELKQKLALAANQQPQP